MLDAEQILRDQAAMENERSAVDGERREVAALLLPSMAESIDNPDFSRSMWVRPATDRIFDETAQLALGDGCSVFEGEVIPQGVTWQKLIPRDGDLLKNRRVALWYEHLTARVFAVRNAARSGFAVASHESVKNLFAFGLQGMWPEPLIDRATGRATGISYGSDAVGQLYVREDHGGNVETTHRKFRRSHRQALNAWKGNPPECAAKAERDREDLDEELTYIHVLTPNPKFEPGREDYLGKPFYSCYLSLADKQVFDEGGYRTRRQIVSRYDKAPGQPYGRGRAMDVLPAVKASQAIMRDLVTAIEFMAKPVLGASDDMLDQLLMYQPGGVTYGAIDARGNKMIQRLWDDPDIAPGLNLQADVRKLIARAFFQDLYMIRDEVKTHVSAFERMARDQQRGILLAPFKRQETEWFTPLLEVELDQMLDMSMLDDMPGEVAEAGGLYQIVYDNPLNRARSADAASGFYGMLDGLTPLMQLDPANTVPAFFEKYPFARVLDGLAPIHGVPIAWQATEDEQNEAASEARALAEKAKLLEVGESAARIAKDLGQAQGATGTRAA